jgi:serine/threonine-protein kinase
MGVVYLARDVSLSRLVAIKSLAPGITNLIGAETLRSEAAALAAIQSRNVVDVFAFGTEEGAPFFVMEYVKGEDLGGIIERHRRHDSRVPLRRALAILRQLASGLDAVHRGGLIHRDVKPGNVLIEEKTGRPVLIDFGLSIPSHTPPGGGGAILVGTPGYVAPEYLKAPVPLPAPTADVFAFACTAYALLTGRRAYDADGLQERLMMPLSTQPAPPSTFVPEIAAFDAAFARAFAKTALARTPTCGDFVRELDAAAEPWLAAKDSAKIPLREAAPPVRTPAVLVVDDDDDVRRLLARAAEVVFHGAPDVSVGAVARGQEALRVAAVRMPSLVVLDYDMPGLNGVDTLTRLRELPGGSPVRVLVVSAMLDEALRWQFDVLGVVDFLRKPFQLRDLIDALSRLGADLRGPRVPRGLT